jgi:hypothetical protein
MKLYTANLSLDHVVNTDVRVLEELEQGDFRVVAERLKLGIIIDLDSGIAVVEDRVLYQVDHFILKIRVVQSICADIFLHLPMHPELIHLEVACGESASLAYEDMIDGGDYLRTFYIFYKKPIFPHWL